MIHDSEYTHCTLDEIDYYYISDSDREIIRLTINQTDCLLSSAQAS